MSRNLPTRVTILVLRDIALQFIILIINHTSKRFRHSQGIQAECLTVSVVAFVVTVELIALQGKMTDVARQECQRSAWEIMPTKQRVSFCLAMQST